MIEESTNTNTIEYDDKLCYRYFIFFNIDIFIFFRIYVILTYILKKIYK